MNEGDLGSENQQHVLSVALNNRAKFDRRSLEDCMECGEKIPEARQKLGSVERCVDCQDTFEKGDKHYKLR